MRPLAACAVCLLLASLGQGSELVVPEQKILGAEKPIPYGELVILSVSPPEKAEHLASTSYTWKVFQGAAEKRFAVDAEGRVFFGSGTGKEGTSTSYLAVVAVTHVYLVREGGQTKQVQARTRILTAQVTVGDPQSPRPPPRPADAAEEKEPSFSGDTLGLALFTWKTVTAKVPAAGRKAVAARLADAFARTAADIKAGKLTDGSAILQRARQDNTAALGKDVEGWLPFLEALMDRLFSLYEGKKLDRPQDYLQAWAEIEAGLREVR